MTTLSCITGTNADLFLAATQLHLAPGAWVADVTYGKGVFWRKIPDDRYCLVPTDLQDGVDFLDLPYGNEVFDAVVFDPPYMNGGAGTKEGLDACYKNPGNNSHEAVMALYLGGILEGRRILKKKGLMFIKCQPAVADHQQKMTHVQIATVLPIIGLELIDEFVLQQTSVPIMRHGRQFHARKNHSYLLVARRTR